jgi:cyclase
MRTPLIALIAILGLVGHDGAHSQGRNSPTGEFGVHRVAGNVYMLDRGTSDSDGGANMAVLVGSDGLVLVDAKVEPWHKMVLAALKQLSDKPVRYVIDTHCHGDHTSGNAAFQREGATVIAHRNVRERLAAPQSYCSPRPGTGLPTVTFDSELTLYIDDEEIRIIKLPAGHTDGDAMVYFKKANVVETGDAFIGVGFIASSLPGSSRTEGGTMLGVIEELRKIVEWIPADAKVVPGHGAQASMSDVRHSLQVLEAMQSTIELQVRAGKTLDEIEKMDLLSPWRAFYGAPCDPHRSCDHQDANSFVRSFYEALSARAPSDAGQKQAPVH